MPSPLNALTVYDNLVLAVGKNGLIVRTTNSGTTWVDSEGKTVISKFNLLQNYPNPFNPSTTIKYSIPSESVMLNLLDRQASSFQHLINSEIPGQARNDAPHVGLKVYDILGKEVATLVNQKQKPGDYEVVFNCHSGEGRNLTSGVYFYKLNVGEYQFVKKMLLLK